MTAEAPTLQPARILAGPWPSPVETFETNWQLRDARTPLALFRTPGGWRMLFQISVRRFGLLNIRGGLEGGAVAPGFLELTKAEADSLLAVAPVLWPGIRRPGSLQAQGSQARQPRTRSATDSGREA
jgi:hypothetical protein